MNIRELILRLQAQPDQDLPVYLISHESHNSELVGMKVEKTFKLSDSYIEALILEDE